MENLKKILDTILLVNKKIWFFKDNITTVSDDYRVCLQVKNSEDMFEKEFGIHSLNQFASAIDLFSDIQLEFSGEDKLIIHDVNSKSKFTYKTATDEILKKTIDGIIKIKEFMNEVEQDKQNKPYIKIHLDKAIIADIKSISSKFCLDDIVFSYENDVLRYQLKNPACNEVASKFDSVIEEVEGKVGSFEVAFSVKNLISDDWDIYLFEDPEWMILENDTFKIVISAND
jgi:hypothetical protein